MPDAVTIVGLKALKYLDPSVLGKDLKSGNSSILKAGKDATFKTMVGNITRIDTTSLMSSAKADDIKDGFVVGFGAGNNSRTGKPISRYSIPQELGFTHYRSGKRIPAMNSVQKTLDAHQMRIVNDLNSIVGNAIRKAIKKGR